MLKILEKIKERREERRKALMELKGLLSSVTEALERQKQYPQMTIEQLETLPEEEIREAVQARCEALVSQKEEVAEGLLLLNPTQKAFYVASYYEEEVNNGGLCQYFVNSSRDTAPCLSDSLEAIGAVCHKEHFDHFIKENKIDVKNLSSFMVRRAKDFEKQTKRYPFEEFDEAFYDMKPIEEYLVKYAKDNLKWL